MADPIKGMTDWDQLKAMLDKKAGDTAGTKIDEAALLAHLHSRVKGQDAILEDVAKIIRLQAAKKQKDKPIANLLFLGPTGTGKTELAKAIAEYLFKDENAMLRFDCSERTGGKDASSRHTDRLHRQRTRRPVNAPGHGQSTPPHPFRRNRKSLSASLRSFPAAPWRRAADRTRQRQS